MTATVQGILLSGIHASRPTASTPPVGSLFSCSTHGLVYVTDGSSWTTWATLGGTYVDPLTTRGDLVYRNATVPARLAVGAANRLLRSDGTDPSWGQVLPADLDVSADNTTSDATTGHHGLLPKLGGGSTNFLRADGTWNAPAGGGGSAVANVGRALYTGGDKTTSTSSFVDVDATNLALTLTTGAHRCRVTLAGGGKTSGSGILAFDIDIDGTRQGQTFGLWLTQGSSNNNFPITLEYVTAALSAGSHTFKLQWYVQSGTATLYASSAVTPALFVVEELQA